MTVLVTHLTSGFDTSNGTSATTASVAPAGGGAVFIGVFSFDVGSPTAPPTITGLGLTWTQVDVNQNFGNYNLTVWKGLGSPSSGTIGIDFGAGNSMSNIVWSVVEATGVDTAAPVSEANGAQNTGITSISTTLTGIAAGNATLGFVGHNITEGINPGAGYAELGESQGTSPSTTIESEWDSGGSTTVDASWTTSGGGAIIGIELAAASSAVTGDAAFTEGNDTVDATGQLSYTGTVAVTEGDDTIDATGDQGSFTGSIAFSERSDTVAASGTFTPTGNTGDVAISEGDDTVDASGTAAAFSARDLTILDFSGPFLNWITGKPSKDPRTASRPLLHWTAELPDVAWEVSAPTT